jgi:hypothetical protein
MWRSGGIKGESISPKLPAPRPRFHGAYRVLLSLAVLFVAVVLVFPLTFGPRVDAPRDLQFGSPSSLPVQIANQNITPLNNVEYGCALAQLTLANGSEIRDAKVVIRGIIRTISGRHAVTVRCESAYIVTAPLKSAEYKLTLTYQAYPWPQSRTRAYRIDAEVNGKGEVTGWKAKEGTT